MSASKVITIPRQFSVHVYEDHPDNYTASCMVSRYGNRGQLFLINGAGFYKHAAAMFEAIWAEGLDRLEGYVTAPHARLLRREAGKFATISIQSVGAMAGHDMVWLVVEKKMESPLSLKEWTAPQLLKIP